MVHGLTVIRELRSSLCQRVAPADRLAQALRCLAQPFPSAEAGLYLRLPEELYFQRLASSSLDSELPTTLPLQPASGGAVSVRREADGCSIKVSVAGGLAGDLLLVVTSPLPIERVPDDFWCLAAEMLAEHARGAGAQGELEESHRLLLERTVRGLLLHPQINAQTILLLAVLTSEYAALFNRALLFMVNRRAGTVQGMFGVTRDDASQLLGGVTLDEEDWPLIPVARQQHLQHQPLSERLQQLRFPLEGVDNPVAQTVLDDSINVIEDLAVSGPGGSSLAGSLSIGSCVCLPLSFGEEVYAVTLLEPESEQVMADPSVHLFLQTLKEQSAKAFALSKLFERQEQALREVRELQERLLQQERLEAVGEVSSAVAHELRNPLVTVGGFARRLSWSLPEGTREKEYAVIVASEVRRIEEMLGNILAFSRGNLSCFTPCHLDEIAQAVVELLAVPCEEKGVRLSLQVGDPCPPLVADAQQLRQVLENLLRNAIEALSEGGWVQVTLGPGRLRGGEALTLSVEDSAGGIPPDILRNIFNPFFTTRSQGTGIGLAVVQRIVVQHHGEIEVSNTATGARFQVRIPLEPPSSGTIDNPPGFG